MKTVDYPYTGQKVQWLYKDANKHIYQDYHEIGVASERIFSDLHKVLTACSEARLLFPTYMHTSPGQHKFNTDNIDLIVEEIRLLVRSRKIIDELDIIGGYGMVEIPGEEPAMQQDLIILQHVRFGERSFKISTSKSIWMPVAIDTSKQYNWQIELAELNAPRLERCLQVIQRKMENIEVFPGPEDIERKKQIWQKGFRMFPSREVIEKVYNDDPPPANFDIAKYLLPPAESNGRK